MLLFVGVSFADTQQLSSYEAIILHASITDPTKDQEPYKLGPVKIPSVQQDGHSIKFVTSCDGCTLKITSDDGDIEYLVTIPEGATTIHSLRTSQANTAYRLYVEDFVSGVTSGYRKKWS